MKLAAPSPAEDHARYSIQSEWTAGLRSQVLEQVKIDPDARLLEVGSGTGVIAASIAANTKSQVFGVDIDSPATSFAKNQFPEICFAVGDGETLPFKADIFNAACCHFLFLWVNNPKSIISDMIRVVVPGGWVIAFAEPDYGGRIDYPAELQSVGELQAEALQRSGADPHFGRKLRKLFADAGLKAVTCGILGAEWHPQADERLTLSEWRTLSRDLHGQLTSSELERLEAVDIRAWRNQERVLFVPTFYAFGQVS